MQPLGRVGRKIAVLVNRMALDGQVLSPEGGDCRLKTRPTIDAHQGGWRQTTCIRVLQELSSCRRALPRHVLNGREQLLAVPSHAQGHQQGDGSGLVISRVRTTMPSSSRWTTATAARLRWRHASHSPFTLHQARLTTSLPDGSFEEREQRLLHLPRIGACRTGRCEQRRHPPGATLTGSQRPGAPFAAVA